jgi:hypothetical protein
MSFCPCFLRFQNPFESSFQIQLQKLEKPGWYIQSGLTNKKQRVTGSEDPVQPGKLFAGLVYASLRQLSSGFLGYSGFFSDQ